MDQSVLRKMVRFKAKLVKWSSIWRWFEVAVFVLSLRRKGNCRTWEIDLLQ